MRTSSGSARKLVVLLGAMALIVTACGDGAASDTTAASGGDTTAVPGAVTTVAGVTTTATGGDFVTIAVLAPLTGEIGEFGQIVSETFQLGIDEINALGLNPCGEIRLVFADTETNPEVAVREADRLIAGTENLVGIFGPSSGEMVALVDTAHEAELVMVSPYSGTTELNELGGDYVYRTVASDVSDGEAAAAWILENGWKDVGFVVQVSESPLSSAEAARAALEAGGSELVANAEVVGGQASYQAELSQVLASNPEVIYMSVGIETGSTILKEADSLGYEGAWMLSADLAGQDTIDQAGADILEGRTYSEGAEADNSLPEYQRFAEVYEEAFGVPPQIFSPNAYDAAILFGLAMGANGGSCTGASINEGYRSVASDGTTVGSYEEGIGLLLEGEDIDYDGAAGTLTFDESGTPPASFAIYQVVDGQWQQAQLYAADFFED